MHKCYDTSSPLFYLDVLIFAYLVLLQVIGIILAFQTLKGKICGLNVSKFLAALISGIPGQSITTKFLQPKAKLHACIKITMAYMCLITGALTLKEIKIKIKCKYKNKNLNQI